MPDVCDISGEIALRWTSLDLSDDKSILVQVMACCHQATSHYLNQCWPRSLPPYSATRPQWINKTYPKIKTPIISSTCVWSSNELKRLDYMTWYQCSRVPAMVARWHVPLTELWHITADVIWFCITFVYAKWNQANLSVPPWGLSLGTWSITRSPSGKVMILQGNRLLSLHIGLTGHVYKYHF